MALTEGIKRIKIPHPYPRKTAHSSPLPRRHRRCKRWLAIRWTNCRYLRGRDQIPEIAATRPEKTDARHKFCACRRGGWLFFATPVLSPSAWPCATPMPRAQQNPFTYPFYALRYFFFRITTSHFLMDKSYKASMFRDITLCNGWRWSCPNST